MPHEILLFDLPLQEAGMYVQFPSEPQTADLTLVPSLKL